MRYEILLRAIYIALFVPAVLKCRIKRLERKSQPKVNGCMPPSTFLMRS